MDNNKNNVFEDLESFDTDLKMLKNELLDYIATTKSSFQTDNTIEVFKNQINETDNDVELQKIKKSIEEQVETSNKFDNSTDIQRTKNLNRNKYSPEKPYI